MRKSALSLTAAIAAAVFFLVATLPPSPSAAEWTGEPGVAQRTIAGAFHVHSTLSDGDEDRTAIARAAARAGLRFVIFTDHGDGTRPVAPPEYTNGVLAIDGVEVSTDGGHYVAIGMARTPYPLGGEPLAVVEDVRRWGGFGFAAHPDSHKAELTWSDWRAPIDGVEWLNVDSEWRDETRPAMARATIAYWFRPGPALASLFDRPVTTLTRWESLAGQRPVVAIAAHDAHGGIPSYESAFRALTLRVVVPAPLTGRPADDAEVLLRSIRAGQAFSVVDGLAGHGLLAYFAKDRAGIRHEMGGVVPPGPVLISARVSMPPSAQLVVFRNGGEVARTTGDRIERTFEGDGVFRIEVQLPGAPGTPPVPWLLSNPIYVRTPAVEDPAGATAAEGEPLSGQTRWHVEKSEGSQGTLTVAGDRIQFRYGLKPGTRASQFAALAGDLDTHAAFRQIIFDARASKPMRVSVQLRYPGSGGGRWVSSVFLDSTVREVVVPVARLVSADHQGAATPDPSEAGTLLFVVDLTNAFPGDDGTFEIGRVRFGR